MPAPVVSCTVGGSKCAPHQPPRHRAGCVCTPPRHRHRPPFVGGRSAGCNLLRLLRGCCYCHARTQALAWGAATSWSRQQPQHRRRVPSGAARPALLGGVVLAWDAAACVHGHIRRLSGAGRRLHCVATGYWRVEPHCSPPRLQSSSSRAPAVYVTQPGGKEGACCYLCRHPLCGIWRSTCQAQVGNCKHSMQFSLQI